LDSSRAGSEAEKRLLGKEVPANNIGKRKHPISEQGLIKLRWTLRTEGCSDP